MKIIKPKAQHSHKKGPSRFLKYIPLSNFEVIFTKAGIIKLFQIVLSLGLGGWIPTETLRNETFQSRDNSTFVYSLGVVSTLLLLTYVGSRKSYSRIRKTHFEFLFNMKALLSLFSITIGMIFTTFLDIALQGARESLVSLPGVVTYIMPNWLLQSNAKAPVPLMIATFILMISYLIDTMDSFKGITSRSTTEIPQMNTRGEDIIVLIIIVISFIVLMLLLFTIAIFIDCKHRRQRLGRLKQSTVIIPPLNRLMQKIEEDDVESLTSNLCIDGICDSGFPVRSMV